MRDEDLLMRLTREHRETFALFARLDLLPPGDERRRDALDAVLVLLGRHADAEEGYFYPAVRHYLPDGEDLAGQKLAEHARLKRLITALEGLSAGDPGFDALVDGLREDLAGHTAAEENELFPRLAAACPPALLDELGRRARAAHADGDRE